MGAGRGADDYAAARGLHEECLAIMRQRVAAARSALGDDAAFDCAWQEGRAMALEEAIRLALGERIERGCV